LRVDFSIDKVISIVGPRRAGKTYFLYDIIKRLKIDEENFIFINFEDDEIVDLNRKEKINFINYHREIYGVNPKYIFLDEIQNLEKWDNFLHSLVEKKKYYIFVTGSSSKLLSREIATQLRGRSLSYYLFTLNFREFLEFRKISFKGKDFYSNYNKIKKSVEEYLKFGAYPEVVLNEEKERILKE